MEKPIFNKVNQIGMVVKDAEASAKRYWDDVGIGPWRFYTIQPSTSSDMVLRGKPVEHSFIAAIANVGDVELELIQPLDGDSLYAEHLAQHGEGLHHLEFGVDDFNETMSHLKEKGYSEIQSGRIFNVGKYNYLNTDKGLSCITEYGEADKGKTFPQPEKIYPPV